MRPVLIGVVVAAGVAVTVAVGFLIRRLEQRIYDSVSTQLQQHRCKSEKDRRMLAKCVTRHWIQRVGLWQAWQLTQDSSQLRVAVGECRDYCWPSA